MKLNHDNWVTIDEWLSGNPIKIYGWIAMDENDGKRSRGHLNSMRRMREAFGLPLGNEHILEWLRYWDSLSSKQRINLRRMKDLSKYEEYGIPHPSTLHSLKETS